MVVQVGSRYEHEHDLVTTWNERAACGGLLVLASEHIEGVGAKRLSGRYLPGRSDWIKTKNREYWRYEMERGGARTVKRARQFV
jgi:ATP-dependent DNA ligase